MILYGLNFRLNYAGTWIHLQNFFLYPLILLVLLRKHDYSVNSFMLSTLTIVGFMGLFETIWLLFYSTFNFSNFEVISSITGLDMQTAFIRLLLYDAIFIIPLVWSYHEGYIFISKKKLISLSIFLGFMTFWAFGYGMISIFENSELLTIILERFSKFAFLIFMLDVIKK